MATILGDLSPAGSTDPARRPDQPLSSAKSARRFGEQVAVLNSKKAELKHDTVNPEATTAFPVSIDHSPASAGPAFGTNDPLGPAFQTIPNPALTGEQPALSQATAGTQSAEQVARLVTVELQLKGTATPATGGIASGTGHNMLQPAGTQLLNSPASGKVEGFGLESAGLSEALAATRKSPVGLPQSAPGGPVLAAAGAPTASGAFRFSGSGLSSDTGATAGWGGIALAADGTANIAAAPVAGLSDTLALALLASSGTAPQAALQAPLAGAPVSQPSPLPLTLPPAALVAVLSQAPGQSDQASERIIVQLDPPELGRVTIDYVFDRQALAHVTITAENPEAARQLRALHSDLVQALERNGLNASDISFQNSHQQGRSRASPTVTADVPPDVRGQDTGAPLTRSPAEPGPHVHRTLAPGHLNIKL